MILKKLLPKERPRERLLEQGASVLSDAELLAVFLRTGVPGENVLEVSHRLLAEFGSLRELLKADQTSFCQHVGLGPAKYCLLQAVMEMARRCLAVPLKEKQAIFSPERAKEYLKSLFYQKTREVFIVLFLNNQNTVLKTEELFLGTINESVIYIREIIKAALAYNAASVLLAHNHPSGSSRPSPSDYAITKKIIRACELMNIQVIDHIVIGKGECFSFAEQGVL